MTPEAVQKLLTRLPYNTESRGETLRSAKAALRIGRAHCLEAALIAAYLLEPEGYPPLLMDLVSVDLLDHVLFIFKGPKGWGSLARSRDPGLHGRRPVFRTLADLARSYMPAYVDATGRITGYGVLDLRTLPRVDWRGARHNLWRVEDELNAHAHVRLKMPDREYAKWRRRYEAFKAKHPDDKPLYFPGQQKWWGTPSPSR